jgi:GAF domain-containing protein
LISFGQILGSAHADSAHRNAFRESELQCLESVADICANAIQNAHYVERVKQLAYLDGLTGIFNRRFFELRIMEEIERARRYGTGMAVIMADIDLSSASTTSSDICWAMKFSGRFLRYSTSSCARLMWCAATEAKSSPLC